MATANRMVQRHEFVFVLARLTHLVDRRLRELHQRLVASHLVGVTPAIATCFTSGSVLLGKAFARTAAGLEHVLLVFAILADQRQSVGFPGGLDLTGQAL